MRYLAIAALFCALTASAQQPIVQPHAYFLNGYGAACAGCKLNTYSAGTTTPLATYTDSTGGTPNTNPVVLGTDGGANIWLGAGSYKLVLNDASGNLLWTVDNVPGSSGGTYLALTGGTLTGALNATSATFSGNVTAGQVNGPVGVTTPNTGAFTTVTASTSVTSPQVNAIINGGSYATFDLAFAACPASASVQCVIRFPAGTWTTTKYNVANCITRSNLTILGAGRPWFNSMTNPTALTGGTIIEPGLEFCGASNVTIKDIGFDDGPTYSTASGITSNGLQFEGASGGSNNLDPLVTNINVENIVSLGSAVNAAFHANLFEHINGLHLKNIAAALDTHCTAIKSVNVNAEGIFGMGCSNDAGVIIKGDGYTTVGNLNLTGIFANSLNNGDSSNGIIIDAEGSQALTNVNISNATLVGTNFGVNMLNNSSLGTGALNNINLSNVTHLIQGLSAGSASCLYSQTGSANHQASYVQVNNFKCIIASGLPMAIAPVQIYNDWIGSQINNFVAVNGSYPSTLGGNITINGWRDEGATTTAATFTTQDSTTVIGLSNYQTVRSNSLSSGLVAGSIINVSPVGDLFANVMNQYTVFRGGTGAAFTVRGGSGATNDLIVQNGAASVNTFIVDDNGNATAASSLVASGAAATTTAGKVAYSGNYTAASSCGSLAGSTGCVQVNVGGAVHYIPAY